MSDSVVAMQRVSNSQRMWIWLAIPSLAAGSASVLANPPLVLHTKGYESPVQGEPDGLLLIAGYGFTSDDRVVYQEVSVPARPGSHPAQIPPRNDATVGTVQIVQIAEPRYALTVRLPKQLNPHHVYNLWVVNAAGEWSTAMTINDPRPQWITPAYVYETTDVASLGRRIRIVGRNLAPDSGKAIRIRLTGPANYEIRAIGTNATDANTGFVAEAVLPPRMISGFYSASLTRDGRTWAKLKEQQLEVRPDPAELTHFAVSDTRFGACRADDGRDDTICFIRAIESAKERGGGVIVVPIGTWDLQAEKQLLLPHNVHLRGTSGSSLIVRHGAGETGSPRALFVLSGDNSVVGLSFSDSDRFTSPQQSAPMFQLGAPSGAALPAGQEVEPVTDIVISGNSFLHVGRAIADSGLPIRLLLVTDNEFAAYDRALQLPGMRYNVNTPYEIEDTVIRSNRFLPGSYLDITSHQGAIASELGASRRVDFSSNSADGTSIKGLQNADDPQGWRAAFFWNLTGNQEDLLVSENRISCSGDKVGDGEAISFDGNGDTFAFNGALSVRNADQNEVSVFGALAETQNERAVDRDRYYRGHWVQIVDGPGVGQVRKIVGYRVDSANGTVRFNVSPGWDVTPLRSSRVVIGREYWHVYAVGNEIDHRDPPCKKSNRSGPAGGGIAMWAPSADSAIEGNRQTDTSGIVFAQVYSVKASSCPTCENSSFFQTFLEIRANWVEGEYDWGSDCSLSGISGSFGASPTPESPPPIEGFAVSIAGNHIRKADGLGGGAIDIVSTWFRGPPPGRWPLVQSLIIDHNVLEDITGASPRAACHRAQSVRSGIRLEGESNVRDATLYGNRCERVDVPISDSGGHTTRLCASHVEQSCECP